MITEALLDKIKALISGYKQPAHPLYGKSDKEVAGIIKSMVSSYLTESKQTLSEGPVSSGYSNVVWGDAMTTSKSGRPSKDWAAGVINPDLVKDISTAATKAGVKVTITHSRTGHKKTTSSGHISRHWNGTGLDVAILDGLGSGGASSKNPGNEKFKEAGLKLKDALVSMGYTWNKGEAGRDRVVLFLTNLGGNHYNHLHISNRLYQGKRWSPGTSIDAPETDSDIEVSKTADDVGFRQEPITPIDTKIRSAQDVGFKQLPVLRYGKTGDEVKKVQQKLIDIYGDDILSKYGVDGRYGTETISAVKKFQKDNPPLKVDGIVGPNTYEKLNIDFQTESVMEMISNDPKFRKILIEETRRAQRLLFEYNEEQTWDSMTDDQKHDALLAVDDDMGPDIADEYTNMSWLRIPDVITNRVDLRPYMKQQPDRRSMMHVRSLIRGIKSRAQEDANAAKFVKAYLAKTMAQNVEDLTSQQVEDLMFKLHDFQASLSNFVPPTPEEQEQSSQAAYNYYKSMPGNWKGD